MQKLGVIFDFNGTMFYDTEKHEKAWLQTLNDLIGREISPQEFKEKIHGRTTKDILIAMLERDISEEEYLKALTKKEMIYQQLALKDVDNFHLIPGLTDFLSYLKEHEVPTAIGTAAPKINMDFYEKHFHLSQWFSQRNIVYDEGNIKGKPCPDIFLRAAESMNMPPEKCIIFEDSPNGAWAANVAGAYKIIIVDYMGTSGDLKDFPSVSAVIPDYKNAERFLS